MQEGSDNSDEESEPRSGTSSIPLQQTYPWTRRSGTEAEEQLPELPGMTLYRTVCEYTVQ